MSEGRLQQLLYHLGFRTDAASSTGSLHAKVTALNPLALSPFPLFGDGSDGDFSPTSNTSLSAGVYRYGTVNIPFGVTVSLSSGNHLVILAKQKITIAGLLTVSGRGGNGGAAGAPNSNPGNPGSNGSGYGGTGGGGGGADDYAGLTDQPGGAGGNTSTGSGGAGGSTYGGSGGEGLSPNDKDYYVLRQLINTFGIGAGGGGGGISTQAGGTAGNGGAGGGAILLCAPQIEVTSSGAVRADGINGGNASGVVGSGSYGGAGGGGGGGGGTAIIIGNKMVISGIISAQKGDGGTGMKASYGAAGNGGAGGNGIVLKVVI